MTMAKRKRDMQLNFRVSADELAVIEQKMSQFGTSNREAYLRKMARQTLQRAKTDHETGAADNKTG